MESLRGKLQLLASHVFVLRSPVQLGPRPLTWGFLNNSLLKSVIIFLAMCLRMPAGAAEELEVCASPAAAVAGAAWPAENCPIEEDS